MDALTLTLTIAFLAEEIGVPPDTIRAIVSDDPEVTFRRLARLFGRDRLRRKVEGRQEIRGRDCPTCGAKGGDPCVGARGQVRASNHRDRRG